MTSLIKPRRPSFNQALLSQIELKRYHLPTFSDAHWIMQLIVEYTSLFKGDLKGNDLSPWGCMSAAAIEDVFETLMSRGEKAAIARAQALKDDGFSILTWFPGPGTDAQWAIARKRALKDGFYQHTVDGD